MVPAGHRLPAGGPVPAIFAFKEILMKKTLILIMAAALLLAGCAEFKTVTDFVCNPTAEQQATAAAMLAALDAAQAVAANFYPAAGMAKASAVLTTIAAGGCFLLTELEEAFKAVDAANTAMAKTAAAKSTATVLVWQLPEYEPLRKLLRK